MAIGRFGQTIGKYLIGIKVIAAAGQPARWGRATGRTIQPPDRPAIERRWTGSGLLLVGPDEIYNADGTVIPSPFSADQFIGNSVTHVVWRDCGEVSREAVLWRFGEPPAEVRIPLRGTEPGATVRGFPSPGGDMMVLYDPCPAGTCYSIVGGAPAEPLQIGAEGKSPSRFSWGPGGGWLLESRVEQNFPLPPRPANRPPLHGVRAPSLGPGGISPT